MSAGWTEIPITWERCTFTWTAVPGVHTHACKGYVGTGDHIHICACGGTLELGVRR